jgi:hypothetical protein
MKRSKPKTKSFFVQTRKHLIHRISSCVAAQFIFMMHEIKSSSKYIDIRHNKFLILCTANKFMDVIYMHEYDSLMNELSKMRKCSAMLNEE